VRASGSAAWLALAGAIALVTAAGAVSNRRQREAEQSPLPSISNGGSRGLAAARAWLAATGRPHRALTATGPAPGEVVLLLAPPVPLAAAEVEALAAHAERGGLVLWAMGDRPQPALEQALGVHRRPAPGDGAFRAMGPFAPHPLFDGLSLRAGRWSLVPLRPGSIAIAGNGEAVGAVSIPVGAGEVIVLAGPEPLENFGLAEADDLALLARLSSLGPVAFDERHLVADGGVPSAAARGGAALALQALLAVALALLALGQRLGVVRVAPAGLSARTARDYLSSLGDLYRRAGAAPELRTAAWRSLRRMLERRAGVSQRASDEEAGRRLAARAPAAARAFERGRAALRGPPGDGALLAIQRAASELERALHRRAPGGEPNVR
jgi:hypothetical protein